MRYRFVARSNDGGNKTGFLEALDEADARRQLERRRLELVQLEIDSVEQPTFVKPLVPLPSVSVEGPKKTAAPSLWNQLDRGRLARAIALFMLVLCLGGWIVSRIQGDKTYRLHLTGHMALVSKQELGDDYLDRVKLGLRLSDPAWQVNRDGSIEARGEDGRYRRGERRAKVHFQMGAEGDYDLEVELALPRQPSQVTFFVDAPGFPPKQRLAKFAEATDGNRLESKLNPMILKRLKKRETRSTAEAAPPPSTSAIPKFDPEAPEQPE